MDTSHYKDFTTSRGIKYHYYFSPSKGAKPTLLLLHGFPSSSFDWHNQVTCLREHGYGLIVPDMLGYGGTDKPLDPHQYKSSLVVKDLMDILDAENIKLSVVIGHDWGSTITARLANYHVDRFIGFGFLAIGYNAPRPDLTFEQLIAFMRRTFDKDMFGYQAYLAEPDTPALCERNFDSFYSLVHPSDAKTLWPEFVLPLDATKKWIQENRQTALNPHIPAEDHAYRKAILKEGGLAGPMCWYRKVVSDVEREDTRQIPLHSYSIEKPVFLGLAEGDPVSPPALVRKATEQWCKNLTIKSFSGSHWLLWDNKDEINVELMAWLDTLVSTQMS